MKIDVRGEKLLDNSPLTATVRSHVSLCYGWDAGMWDWMGRRGLGGVVMVGGPAPLYCYHKSLHDRHLLQSILTGVFRERLPTAQGME